MENYQNEPFANQNLPKQDAPAMQTSSSFEPERPQEEFGGINMAQVAIAVVVLAIVGLGALYGYGWWQARTAAPEMGEGALRPTDEALPNAPELPTDTALDAVLQEVKDETADQLAAPLPSDSLNDLEAALDAVDENTLMGDLGI